MRRRTTSAALGGLAALVLTLATPVTPAAADQGDTVKGGCGMYSEGGGSQNALQQGFIYLSSASQEASGTPSGATVQCWIDVNGSEYPGTRIVASGTGAQSNSAQLAYRASRNDTVSLCEQVTFVDGSVWVARDGNVGVDCPAVNKAEIPPAVVTNTVETVLGTAVAAIDGLQHSQIDPVLCPELVQLGILTGGGVVGVHIHADGDVWVPQVTGGSENQIYDCPPYDGYTPVTISAAFDSIVIRWLTPSG